MATGRPSDVNAEGWYTLAVQLDQNRATDEAFQASSRSGPAPVQPSSRPGLLPMSKVVPPPQPSRFSHRNPTPGNPVPMDIDAARKAKSVPDACRRCGKLGHWAKDCDLRFDVRYLDLDELSALIEDRLAALDSVPPEPEDEPVEQKMPAEDFVSSSE
ncbi:hypothetical protein M413DRAFT_430631 [Hebeloma cylindrosporum]|uniref:CCHC-type domain-containing protein n=1 Tax=Hebeloma cylindrosporum TaxID=76867 RepID=A0A0C2XCM2_HEBCY|nr:hypothetical protein M413DRAFT_430631 [Hebeloma cylindrosporum h7]